MAIILTLQQKKELLVKLRAFEQAAVNLSWAGAAPPEDRQTLDAEYEAAMRDLYVFLGLLK